MTEWTKIPNNDRKWELKRNDIVLATIYHKPLNEKYSLYVSAPFIFAKPGNMGITHQFETLEEAKEQFVVLCKEKALPWCREMVNHFEELKKNDS